VLVPGLKRPIRPRSVFWTTSRPTSPGPRHLRVLSPLVVLPEFGREVPGGDGRDPVSRLLFRRFVVHVNLGGLLPDHKYILTLNGNPERQGNDMLVDPVPNNAMEKYYDFLTVTTGANGQYDATFDIRLPAGPYDVRFYVKDSADFKIVLYRNFFKFKVD